MTEKEELVSLFRLQIAALVGGPPEGIENTLQKVTTALEQEREAYVNFVSRIEDSMERLGKRVRNVELSINGVKEEAEIDHSEMHNRICSVDEKVIHVSHRLMELEHQGKPAKEEWTEQAKLYRKVGDHTTDLWKTDHGGFPIYTARCTCGFTGMYKTLKGAKNALNAHLRKATS